jgi:hypothetical protein
MPEWNAWMEYLNGLTGWTDWVDWLGADWLSGLAGCWLTGWLGVDWLGGWVLTGWVNWLGWLTGVTDWVDWLGGLAEWTGWVVTDWGADWLNEVAIITVTMISNPWSLDWKYQFRRRMTQHFLAFTRLIMTFQYRGEARKPKSYCPMSLNSPKSSY